MKKLIYKSITRRWYNKYTRVRSEYYQDGDIVKKYTIVLSKSIERGTGWTEGSHFKSSWQIDDKDLPEWLHQYIDYHHVSDTVKESIAERNALEILSHCTNPKSTHPWVDVKHLITAAYQRERLTSKLLNRFKSDWLNHKIDYDSLLERADDNQKIIASRKFEREKKKQELIDLKNFGKVKYFMDNLVDMIHKIIPQVSEAAVEELNLIIELVNESDVTQSNYNFLYKEYLRIIRAEKKEAD